MPFDCFEDALKSTYDKIKRRHSSIDSFDVVQEVVKYRNYWRPDEIRVVLLAESHVYTSDDDFKIKLEYTGFKMSPNYHSRFVRFVYCLGYSEPRLYANSPVNPHFKNPGTWQFWKLFCACDSESQKIDCAPYLKGTTGNIGIRINNKIELLKRLKEKGIWLVDSSIAGINKLQRKQREEIILTSWNEYVKQVIEAAKPKAIVCIGKTVWDTLENEIRKMSLSHDYIHQPQAHLTSKEREIEHKKLQRICSEYCTSQSPPRY